MNYQVTIEKASWLATRLNFSIKIFLVLVLAAFTFGCETQVPKSTGQIAVTIMGAVQHPGRYFLPPGSNLVDAIQIAGDFNDFAYLKKIRITNQNGTVAYYNYRLEPKTCLIKDGDKIFVNAAFFGN